nr:serine/threonine-protein kinase pepkr2 [Quercus suber]
MGTRETNQPPITVTGAPSKFHFLLLLLCGRWGGRRRTSGSWCSKNSIRKQSMIWFKVYKGVFVYDAVSEIYFSVDNGNHNIVLFSTLNCIMEAHGKKRKGLDILVLSHSSLKSLSTIWSHSSLENSSRHKKKCKEDEVKAVGSCKSVFKGIVTAPPCGSTCPNSSGRGLKRKIGCINAATQMGRKKKIEQDYDLVVTIGQGRFGSVMLCRSRVSGEEFACKILRKGGELVYQEVEIMQHLSGHPGVVTIKAVYEDMESFYLVMEFCSGGRLLDHMAREGQYSEYRAANVLKELILVIKYCHDMGVVHRDIKPENILLTSSGQMKLADFGLAMRVSNGQSLAGVVGSPAYVAPEVLIGQYSEKVDIWSAGVLLHALLLGVLPFQGDSVEAIFEAIKKVKLDFKSGVWESVSQPARNLIAHMLTRDVSARLTADEILSQSLAGVVGSPAYVAPEVLIGQYSEKVDIWSAGVLLHALLVGVLPFQGDSVEAIFEAIKKVKLDFKSGVWESVSQPARNLIAHMLTRDVSARLTADEILRHPWILLYTEQTPQTLTLKTKTRNRVKLSSRKLTTIPGVESEMNKLMASSFLCDYSSLNLSSDRLSGRSEEQDCGLVDALAVAISHVRISEPKRIAKCLVELEMPFHHNMVKIPFSSVIAIKVDEELLPVSVYPDFTEHCLDCT